MDKRISVSGRVLAMVFFVEFCYMGMELLASRLLSPYFGTTLDVWTSILSVVLAAGAVGNFTGAKWCERKMSGWGHVCAMLGIAATAFAWMPALSISLGAVLSQSMERFGGFVCSFGMFAIPGFCFGCVNPMLVDLYSESKSLGAGRSAGVVSSVMTLGGIVGTIACGFFLVPALGARDLSMCMAAMLYFLAAVSGMSKIVKERALRVCVYGLVAVVLGSLGMSVSMCSSSTSLTSAMKSVDFWRDTEYGHVHVYDAMWSDGPIRVLNVDGGFESAMYLDEDRSYDLVFDYAQTYRDLMGEGGGKMVALGGGAYSIPRAMAHAGWDVTCVEIDPGVTQIAREYFGLAETERDYALECVNDDGRVWLAQNAGFGADVVFNDTFAGEVPARTLATKEAVASAKGVLKDGGLFVVNVIGTSDADSESILADEVAAIEEVFDNVFVIDDGDGTVGGVDNYLVVGTDGDWRPPESVIVCEANGANIRPLTDDWCPVEWLCSMN